MNTDRRTQMQSGPMHAHQRAGGYIQEAVFHHTGELVYYEATMPVRVWMETKGVTVHVTRGYWSGPTIIALCRNSGETVATVEINEEGWAGSQHTVALPEVTYNAGDLLWLNVLEAGGANRVVVQVLLKVASTEGPPPPPPVAT